MMRALSVGLFLLGFVLALPAHAQETPTGIWSGLMASPGKQPFEIRVEVTPVGDSLSAVMTVREWSQQFTFYGFRVRHDQLSFTWSPSFQANCLLDRQANGTFQGSCQDPQGRLGPVVLAPPGKSVNLSMLDPKIAFRPWEVWKKRLALMQDERPVGKKVDVGGRKLNAHITGSGPVTVLLEAGMGDNLRTWDFIQFELEQVARVVSYDRAGLGHSDESPHQRTPAQAARELHALLTKAGVEGPYVLVGHALGSLYSRAFAALYPEEIAGIVLIDPEHEQQAARWRALDPARWTTEWRRKVNLFEMSDGGLQADFQVYRALMEKGTAAGVGALPRVPLVVITPTRATERPGWIPDTPKGQQVRKELQATFAQGHPSARQILTPYSGSYVHREEPDLVVKVIREMVRTVRPQGSSPTSAR